MPFYEFQAGVEDIKCRGLDNTFLLSIWTDKIFTQGNLLVKRVVLQKNAHGFEILSKSEITLVHGYFKLGVCESLNFHTGQR